MNAVEAGNRMLAQMHRVYGKDEKHKCRDCKFLTSHTPSGRTTCTLATRPSENVRWFGYNIACGKFEETADDAATRYRK